MLRGPGFARLVALVALTGLATATVALLASARPAHAPVSVRAPADATGPCAPCSEELPPPSASAGIRDARGKLWSLAELKPGALLEGADLRRAQWHGVSLPGVIFV